MRKLCAALAVACALAGSISTAAGAGSRAPGDTPQTTPRVSSPPTFDIVEKSIADLQAAMRSGAVTSRQLVEAYLARIRKYDQDGPKINAFITLNAHALEAADALDAERRSKGPRGMLHGIPIVVKDNYVTADLPTTGGSKALAGFESGRDAFMVKKLRDAGVVIIGKTNLHELAYGITTISSMGGQTRNPYDLTRNPGGSSGGTGAAIAANFAAAGMGTDTCGSIRIPSANNNLVGLRGTKGLSSRTGIIPLALTQDIGGPLARSVTDLSIMLDATVGADPQDPETQAGNGHIPPSYAGGARRPDLSRYADRNPDAALWHRARGRRSRRGGSPGDQGVSWNRHRSRRGHDSRPGRSPSGDQRHQCGVQVSADGLSAAVPTGAGPLARGDSGERPLRSGGRRRVQACRSGGVARLGRVSGVARQTQERCARPCCWR